MTRRDRDGGEQTTILDNTASPLKVCMCGVWTQKWPSTQITLFERTRQSAWLDAVTRHWQEASEFLSTKTPLFLFEGVEQPKKSPQKPGDALSDALIMSCLQNFVASAAKKNGTPRFFESVLLVNELMGGPNAGGVGRIGENAAACRVVVLRRGFRALFCLFNSVCQVMNPWLSGVVSNTLVEGAISARAFAIIRSSMTTRDLLVHLQSHLVLQLVCRCVCTSFFVPLFFALFCLQKKNIYIYILLRYVSPRKVNTTPVRWPYPSHIVVVAACLKLYTRPLPWLHLLLDCCCPCVSLNTVLQ